MDVSVDETEDGHRETLCVFISPSQLNPHTPLCCILIKTI